MVGHRLSPRLLYACAHAVLTLATVAVLLGGFIAPASPQSTCIEDSQGPACEGGEGRAINPDSSPPMNPEAVTPDASARPGVRPWWPRPGPVAEWPRDGWTMEGSPFIGPDGRTCWPHGDHFHCR